MKNTVFDYLDYKKYLIHWIESRPAKGYGVRGQMAKAIRCQTAFISQVINGNSHLSMEQAELLNSFLGHSEEEAIFFLLLLQYTRAGIESLRARLKKQISEILEKRNILKERLHSSQELSKEDHSIYFSSWMYAAINIAVAIPDGDTKTAIAKNLKLPMNKVIEVLDFLVSRGLLKQSGDRFSVGDIHLHLANTSSMITKHHNNWRLKAMESVDFEHKNELHYSSVVTISQSDLPKIKKLLVNTIDDARKIFDPSKPEEIYSLCLDFFQVNRS